MKIGDRIKQKRLDLKLSQKELAIACDWLVSDSSARISHYENNLREPHSADIVKLAHALNVNPGWLLFGEDFGENKILPILSYHYKNLAVISMEDTEKFLAGTLDNIQTTPFISDKKELTNRNNIFFTYMRGDSMVSSENSKQSCSDGDMLLIDPDTIPKNGDLALIIDDRGYSKIRKLYKDGSEDIFLPMNRQYESLSATKAKKVLGTVILIQKILVN